MTSAIVVAFLWLAFGGTHVGLAAARGRLVPRLGEIGFVVLFYLVAAATFTALVMFYAAHRFEGAPGPALGGIEAVRWLLMSLAAGGFALAVPALVYYPGMPSALFTQTIRAPRGIEKTTRHPFFAGISLFALAHALLATHLVGTVFFGGLLLFVALGMRHQDAKLLARHGAPYAEYLKSTSAVPFGAILAGRQRLDYADLPLGTLAIGLALALALRRWHESIFADGGAWIVGVTLVGALFAGLGALRRSRRVGGRPVGDAPGATPARQRYAGGS